MNSLDYFMLAQKCQLISPFHDTWYHPGSHHPPDRCHTDEKNEKSKILIRCKIEEYLSRTETLKKHLQAQEEQKSRSISANGTVAGVRGKGYVVCYFSLGALTPCHVQKRR